MSFGARAAIRAATVAALLLAGTALAQRPPIVDGPLTEDPTFEPKRFAQLQGLDKITARIWKLEVPVGEISRFGTLEFAVHDCRKRPPIEPPESAVFLEIQDHLQDGSVAEVFYGWMFASSPALSALEHPVYDLWLLDCLDEPTPTPEVMTGDPDEASEDVSGPRRPRPRPPSMSR